MNPQNNMIFCTLFDSNYLDKGLALYQSMKKNIDCFKLYIFAFDNKCFDVLSDMRLENVIPVALEDIMNARLQQIKKERTNAEFCWTCSPIVIEYVLETYKEDVCTYIDADIYFFSSPMNTIQEIVDDHCSVGLVEHRFERNYNYGNQVFGVGKYCIQFNTFFNNEEGLRVLRDWKEDCLNWCYNRYGDERLGDQKYPDKWKMKYSGIHESGDLGAGVAPWNLHLYNYLGRENGNIFLEYRGRRFSLVFYHFEGIKYLDDNKVYLNLWKPEKTGTGRKIKLLYKEYFKNIAGIRKYLYESYGITFAHMLIKQSQFRGKAYSLEQFCKRDGIINGFTGWLGYWRNNFISL